MKPRFTYMQPWVLLITSVFLGSGNISARDQKLQECTDHVTEKVAEHISYMVNSTLKSGFVADSAGLHPIFIYIRFGVARWWDAVIWRENNFGKVRVLLLSGNGSEVNIETPCRFVNLLSKLCIPNSKNVMPEVKEWQLPGTSSLQQLGVAISKLAEQPFFPATGMLYKSLWISLKPKGERVANSWRYEACVVFTKREVLEDVEEGILEITLKLVGTHKM